MRPAHAILAGLLLAPSGARAHGQFPVSAGTLLRGDGADPLLVTSFGILVPRDGALGWICEESVGGGAGLQVAWARMADGTLIAGSTGGVFRFTADLCDV